MSRPVPAEEALGPKIYQSTSIIVRRAAGWLRHRDASGLARVLEVLM
jgi:hypothetical protein